MPGRPGDRADKLAKRRMLFNLIALLGLVASILPAGACFGSGHACCCTHESGTPAAPGPALAADCPCPGPALGCAPETQPLAPSPDRVTLPAASSAPAMPVVQPASGLALVTRDLPAATPDLGAGPPIRTLLCTLRI